MKFNTSANFTQEQIELINKFRLSVSDVLESEFEKTEAFLSKWLIARSWDSKKAEIDLRNYKCWRKENRVDCVLSENFDDMKIKFPIDVGTGFDKSGRPLVIFHCGNKDFKKFFESPEKRERLMRYVVYIIEEVQLICRKQYGKTGGIASKPLCIADLDGFSIMQVTSTSIISGAIEIVKIIESYYPCAFEKTFVINAPKFFKVLHTAIRPFLSAYSNSNIKVHDSNKTVWKEALLDHIDSHQHPILTS